MIRLEFVVGVRAIRLLKEMYGICSGLKVMMNCPHSEILSCVERLKVGMKKEKKSFDTLSRLYFQEWLKGNCHRKIAILLPEDPALASSETQKTFISVVKEMRDQMQDKIALIGCLGSGDNDFSFSCINFTNSDGKILLQKLGAKGFAKNEFIQGKILNSGLIDASMIESVILESAT